MWARYSSVFMRRDLPEILQFIVDAERWEWVMSVEILWEDLAQGSFTILKLVVFRRTKNKSGQLQSYFPAGQHLLEKC